jgi:isoleucyl-tRNA synthetase
VAAWNKNIRKNVMKLNNKYFLLRHGQTIYQKQGLKMNYGADENPVLSLTDEGIKMVKEAAEKLKKENISLIFSSPYERTMQTAETVAEVLGISKEEIKYDDRIVDINLGKFMGRPMEESFSFYFFGDKKFDNRPEGGESWDDILARVKSFLEDLEKRYTGKNILIVSHADPIWIMAGYLREYKNEEEFMEARADRENSYPKLAQIIKA